MDGVSSNHVEFLSRRENEVASVVVEHVRARVVKHFVVLFGEVFVEAGGMKGSNSQMTRFSTAGYRVKAPAVIPAPKPTTNTDRGWGWISAGRCPIMRSSRMSRIAVEASALPLT